MQPDWIRCSDRLPPKGFVVETKIDDAAGCRNEANLKRGGTNGRLWFFADDSMYVYYTPTHWRPFDVEMMAFAQEMAEIA